MYVKLYTIVCWVGGTPWYGEAVSNEAKFEVKD
jgi:hypothetical protein